MTSDEELIVLGRLMERILTDVTARNWVDLISIDALVLDGTWEVRPEELAVVERLWAEGE